MVRVGGDPKLGGGGSREEEVDPGVHDKRALFVENEFGGTLSVLGREGNNLSPVIRNAWDKGTICSATKNNPARTTNAHISIIAQITGEELRRKLTANDTANGFANRFLWVCARRTRLLPHGGRIHTVDFSREIHELQGVKQFVEEMHPDVPILQDAETRALWDTSYKTLSEEGPGLLSAVASRAEAQTLRLAALYAMLDYSHYIRVEHLQAALAVWKYCEESAKFIFGDQLGDPDAEKLLLAIREAGESGLTLTQINRTVFHGHKGAAEISRILASLHRSGLVEQVEPEAEASDGKPKKVRRPPIVWRAKNKSSAESADFEYFSGGDDATHYAQPF